MLPSYLNCFAEHLECFLTVVQGVDEHKLPENRYVLVVHPVHIGHSHYLTASYIVNTPPLQPLPRNRDATITTAALVQPGDESVHRHRFPGETTESLVCLVRLVRGVGPKHQGAEDGCVPANIHTSPCDILPCPARDGPAQRPPAPPTPSSCSSPLAWRLAWRLRRAGGGGRGGSVAPPPPITSSRHPRAAPPAHTSIGT